ncbi:TIGR03435 family protein [Acidobacteria bacterium AB60]|nr:TIGR03435 family protein [Acidobacteria bacterium AB60]
MEVCGVNRMPTLRRANWVIAILALGLMPSMSQTPAAALKEAGPVGFDVAVIRPTAAGDVMGSSHFHIWSAPTDSHFKAQNVTAFALIRYAYEMPEFQVEGGPGWIRSKAFDVEARSDAALDEEFRKLPSAEARQRKLRMIQTLLAERFGLRVHQETRTEPVYALVVARGGPRFSASKADGTTVSNSQGAGGSTMTVKGSDHTLRILAEQLSRTMGRVVLDKTGLDGRFDLTLKWVPDDVTPSSPDAPGGPSLFTALQEQLGLQLKEEKDPVQVLVIDHIDPPSDN